MAVFYWCCTTVVVSTARGRLRSFVEVCHHPLENVALDGVVAGPPMMDRKTPSISAAGPTRRQSRFGTLVLPLQSFVHETHSSVEI